MIPNCLGEIKSARIGEQQRCNWILLFYRYIHLYHHHHYSCCPPDPYPAVLPMLPLGQSRSSQVQSSHRSANIRWYRHLDRCAGIEPTRILRMENAGESFRICRHCWGKVRKHGEFLLTQGVLGSYLMSPMIQDCFLLNYIKAKKTNLSVHVWHRSQFSVRSNISKHPRCSCTTWPIYQ